MATRNEAYSFLEAYKKKSAKIRLLEIEADRIKSAIFRMTQIFSGEGFSNTNDNSRERMIVGYLVIQDQIIEEECAAASLRSDIADVVDIVEGVNENCALVLRSRYLSFLSVKKSAKELGYSEARIKQLSQEGVDNAALVLSIKKEQRKKEIG